MATHPQRAARREPDFARVPSDIMEKRPPSDQHGRVDIDRTLTAIWRMAQVHSRQAETSASAHKVESAQEQKKLKEFEEKITRGQRWGGWVWGFVSILAAIFAAGASWAVFLGDNTMDGEMREEVRREMAEHNGGVHPDTIDPTTHQPVGNHAELREGIEANTKAITELTNQAKLMVENQEKLDKRSYYQFELGRWQSKVMEAERQRKRPPGKPPILSTLESELMMGR